MAGSELYGPKYMTNFPINFETQPQS